MNTLEHIRIEITKAQDALAEARDSLLRVRRSRDADTIIDALRRSAAHLSQAVTGCERLKEGIL